MQPLDARWVWLTLAGLPAERKVSFCAAFGKQVAVHGPGEVEGMIAHAGFSAPVQCFQAALVRGWVATRV